MTFQKIGCVSHNRFVHVNCMCVCICINSLLAQTNKKRHCFHEHTQPKHTEQNYITLCYTMLCAWCYMDVMRYDCKHTEKRQLKIATIASLCTTLHNCREEVCERDRKLREQSGDARKNEKSIKFHPPKNISQPIYTQ